MRWLREAVSFTCTKGKVWEKFGGISWKPTVPLPSDEALSDLLNCLSVSIPQGFKRASVVLPTPIRTPLYERAICGGFTATAPSNKTHTLKCILPFSQRGLTRTFKSIDFVRRHGFGQGYDRAKVMSGVWARKDEKTWVNCQLRRDVPKIPQVLLQLP